MKTYNNNPKYYPSSSETSYANEYTEDLLYSIQDEKNNIKLLSRSDWKDLIGDDYKDSVFAYEYDIEFAYERIEEKIKELANREIYLIN